MRLVSFPPSDTEVPTDAWTAPHWQAAGRGEVAVPRCQVCGRTWMQPKPFCPSCRSQDIAWPVMSGAGTLYSFTVLPHPRENGASYAPAIVELDDAPGVRLISNVVEAEADELAIGMELEAVFEPLADGLGFVVFRPVRP